MARQRDDELGHGPDARGAPRAASRHPRQAGAAGAAGTPAIPEDLSELMRMARPEFIALWPLVAAPRREPPPAQRSLLAREIAWRVQERAHGGLDADTRRLLAAAIRELERTPKRAACGSGSTAKASEPISPETRARPRRDRTIARVRAAELPPSARLVRIWPAGSNVRHEVTVLDGGRAFEYRGRRYPSLTQIARAITGTHWSGPRFFGLSTRRAGRIA